MSVKDKLMELYIDVAWNTVLCIELTNNQKVRVLSNIIYDDIPSIERLDEAGVW